MVLVMHGPEIRYSFECRHASLSEPQGLSLITIGNTLRQDDGVASYLCDTLSENDLKDVCRFDLGTYTNHLASCLWGHKAAIIIDATNNGTAPGTISLVDLNALLDRASPLAIKCCHGFSIADELRIAKKQGRLPRRIIFFGVEADNTEFGTDISAPVQSSLRWLNNNLSILVSQVLSTLKKEEKL